MDWIGGIRVGRRAGASAVIQLNRAQVCRPRPGEAEGDRGKGVDAKTAQRTEVSRWSRGGAAARKEREARGFPGFSTGQMGTF